MKNRHLFLNWEVRVFFYLRQRWETKSTTTKKTTQGLYFLRRKVTSTVDRWLILRQKFSTSLSGISS